jgi:hypothetical protein
MCPILGDLRGTNVWFCELIFFFFFCPPKDCGKIRAAFSALPACAASTPLRWIAGSLETSPSPWLNQLPSPLPVLQEAQGNEHLYCMYRPHVKTTAYYRRSKHAAKKIKPSTVLMSRSKSFPRATRKVLSARHSDSDVLHTFQFFKFLWWWWGGGGGETGRNERSQQIKETMAFVGAFLAC